jgi:hypothetical protein
MSADLARRLADADLSEEAVMARDLRAAREAMVAYRVAEGFRPAVVKLLTAPDENIKLTHSGVDQVAAFGLSLAPADLSGNWNTCRYSTAGCRAACLATSGNGRYSRTQAGRVWKTRWLAERPLDFLRVLVDEIDRIKVEKWSAAGWTVSLRLNVLSDLPWEAIAPWIVERATARGIRLYDYSKWPTSKRAGAAELGYDISESVSERTTTAQLRGMRRPVVVVDVKRGHALPEQWNGRPVVDGDRSDARFLDPAGCAVLLRFKAVTTTDRTAAVASGFVRRVA